MNRDPDKFPTEPILRSVSNPPTWMMAPQQLGMMSFCVSFLTGLILAGVTGIKMMPVICLFVGHMICIAIGKYDPHIGGIITNFFHFAGTIPMKYRKVRGAAWRMNP